MSPAVRLVAWLAVTVAVAACQSGGGGGTAQSTTVAPALTSTTSTKSGRCPTSSVEMVDSAATVTLGPSPGIDASAAAGRPLVVSGTVYDDRCAPLAGAVLHVWQTDGDGVYGPGHGTDELRCCYLQGTVRSDSNGRYQLITVMPGHYRGEQRPPPAHIHVEASHPSGGIVMTEIVFADDPYLENPDAGGYVVVTLTTGPGSDDTRRGIADLLLGSS